MWTKQAVQEGGVGGLGEEGRKGQARDEKRKGQTEEEERIGLAEKKGEQDTPRGRALCTSCKGGQDRQERKGEQDGRRGRLDRTREEVGRTGHAAEEGRIGCAQR